MSQHTSSSIDIHKRNSYWNSFLLHKKESDLLYHLAGADKLLSENELVSSFPLLLFYTYRFALEQALLIFFLKTYSSHFFSALDCGGGTGRNALVISKFFQHVDCFDISDVMMVENKQRFSSYKNINFFTSSFDAISKNTRYDCIFVGGVFMCMTDEEVIRALDTLKEVLSPNGVLIVRDTLSHKETTFFEDIKIYRSVPHYLSLFDQNIFLLERQTNTTNRNFWVSIYGRLPQIMQKYFFSVFSFLVRLTIGIDAICAKKKPFVRHRMSSQLFHVFRNVS